MDLKHHPADFPGDLLDRNSALASKRLTRIHKEVQKDLLQPPWMAANRGNRLCALNVESEVRESRLHTDKSHRVLDDLRHLDSGQRLFPCRLVIAVCWTSRMKQVANDVVNPVEFCTDTWQQILMQTLGVLLQHLNEADHRGQGIAHLMSYSSGQATHRRHLLCEHQTLLRLLQIVIDSSQLVELQLIGPPILLESRGKRVERCRKIAQLIGGSGRQTSLKEPVPEGLCPRHQSFHGL